MKHILAVSSGGGHWHQLNLLAEGFSKHQVTWLSTIQNPGADNISNAHQLPDADSTQPLRLVRMALQVFFFVLKTRPDFVISTGAAIGFFAVLFGRMLGAHTIWVDSVANYHKLSISGRYAAKICHLHLTQWPELADGETTRYWGSLL